jgi:hypothetical protein
MPETEYTQLLCRNTNPSSDCHSNANTNLDCAPNFYHNPDCDSYIDAHCDAHSNDHTHSDPDLYPFNDSDSNGHINAYVLIPAGCCAKAGQLPIWSRHGIPVFFWAISRRQGRSEWEELFWHLVMDQTRKPEQALLDGSFGG